MSDSFRTLRGSLPWTDKTSWRWPAEDRKGLSRCFVDGPKDIDDALPIVSRYLSGHRRCIQAGGACGVWPTRLAQLFDRVDTFESDPVNYVCLVANTEGIDNIETHHAALKCDHVGVRSVLDDGEKGNHGAFYVRPGGNIRGAMIDDLGYADVDLIYLDIEGSEYDALLGAVETIERCRPVIGLEDKNHWRRYGHKRSPVAMLQADFDYRIVGVSHLDKILAC